MQVRTKRFRPMYIKGILLYKNIFLTYVFFFVFNVF